MADANISLSAKQIEVTIAALNLADEDNLAGQKDRDAVRVILDQALTEAQNNGDKPTNVHMTPKPVQSKGAV